jgi:hypothetical protein
MPQERRGPVLCLLLGNGARLAGQRLCWRRARLGRLVYA